MLHRQVYKPIPPFLSVCPYCQPRVTTEERGRRGKPRDTERDAKPQKERAHGGGRGVCQERHREEEIRRQRLKKTEEPRENKCREKPSTKLWMERGRGRKREKDTKLDPLSASELANTRTASPVSRPFSVCCLSFSLSVAVEAGAGGRAEESRLMRIRTDPRKRRR